MKRRCPLCHADLIEERWLFHADHSCQREDHFFGERVVEGCVIVVKVCLRNAAGPRLCLKVYYSEGWSEVWTGSSRTLRVVVPLIVDVDFTNAEGIRRAVRYWLQRGTRLRWRLVSAGK